MGQCLSFLSTGVWSSSSMSPEEMARWKKTKVNVTRTHLGEAAKKVSDKKKELMSMYDAEGIPLPDHQYEVGAKIIEYQAAVREYRICSASYSEWLDLISAAEMTRIANEDSDLKRIVEAELKKATEENERRRNRNNKTGESKQQPSIAAEAKQAAVETINDIHRDQESDPLLQMVEASDSEMSFGAQVRKWKTEEKRSVASLQQEDASLKLPKPKSKKSSNGASKTLTMPLDVVE